MAISLASLRRGGDARPPRLLTYGVAGVGKTLFATSAPHPVVVQTEDGLGTISAATFGVLRSFDAVMEALGSLYTEAHDFETLVVDSLDWLEPLVWQHTARTHNQPDIESFGYGKGYLAALDTWRSFLDGVNALRDERGMGVILIAHAEKDRLFTDIAFQVPVLEMIQQGYLCPVVPKQTSTQLDVGSVGTRGGEFIAKDLEAAVDRDEVTRAAVTEIVQHGAGRGSWLVFCSGVAHARHVRDAIREHGISAETVTGDTPGPERDQSGTASWRPSRRGGCAVSPTPMCSPPASTRPAPISSRCCAPRRASASTSRWSAVARASPRARMTAWCWTSPATPPGTVRSTWWTAGRRNPPAMARRRSRCAPSARPSTTPARGTASSATTSSRRQS